MERVLRLARVLGQWSFVAGLILAVLGLMGWLLLLLHRPSQFLVSLGVLSLPLFFLGFVFILVAALLAKILHRHPPA